MPHVDPMHLQGYLREQKLPYTPYSGFRAKFWSQITKFTSGMPPPLKCGSWLSKRAVSPLQERVGVSPSGKGQLGILEIYRPH